MAELTKKTAEKPKEKQIVYKGSPSYSNLFDANPYKNVDYRQSGWQRFLENLGFRTDYDAFKENMAVQAAETDFNLMLKQHDEQYDSAVANANRERAAGLNPDLIGTDQGGKSAAMPEDGNPPMAAADDSASVSQFANVVMSAVTGAMGFAKDIGAVNAITLGNEKSRMENAGSMFDLAQKIMVNSIGREDFNDPLKFHGKVLANSQNLAQRLYGYNTRRYRKFNNFVQGIYDKIPTEKKAFEEWLGDMKAVQSGYMFQGRTDYNDSLPLMKIVGQELGKFAKDMQYLRNKAEKETAANEADYAETFDGELKAESENLKNDYESNYYANADGTQQGTASYNEANIKSYRAKEVKAVNDFFDSVTEKVTKLADGGDTMSTIFLAFFAYLRLQMFKF